MGTGGPLLHDGSVASLDEMFDPQREAPGHPFGLSLEPADREALVSFLRSI